MIACLSLGLLIAFTESRSLFPFRFVYCDFFTYEDLESAMISSVVLKFWRDVKSKAIIREKMIKDKQSTK